MSSFKVKTDSNILANAFAIWFESGEAIASFLTSEAARAAIEVEPKIECIEQYTTIDWGSDERNPDHECEVDFYPY